MKLIETIYRYQRNVLDILLWIFGYPKTPFKVWVSWLHDWPLYQIQNQNDNIPTVRLRITSVCTVLFFSDLIIMLADKKITNFSACLVYCHKHFIAYLKKIINKYNNKFINEEWKRKINIYWYFKYLHWIDLIKSHLNLISSQ